MAMAMAAADFNTLPEDCVAAIFSLTSPRQACRLAMVSSAFRSVADSDAIWDGFLPSDYSDIISRALSGFKFSSKKELFFGLSDSILIDCGCKSFSIDKSCGRKSYILSARELSILHGDEQSHWSWKSVPESRFSEVVELKTVSRLEIQGRIRTQMLSPNTKYGAYLIIKISDCPFGLDSIPCEISVAAGDYASTGTALIRDGESKKNLLEGLLYMNRMQMLKQRMNHAGDNRLPRRRDDGWMEIELGEFFNGEADDKEVTMSLMEVIGHQLKGGLVVEGIEVRPKD